MNAVKSGQTSLLNTEKYWFVSSILQSRKPTKQQVNIIQQLTSPQNQASWELADNNLACWKESALLKQLASWALK